jgi:hypothetical protein
MKTINMLCEVKMKVKYGILILILVSAFILGGCKNDQTASDTATPDGSAPSYPEPVVAATTETSPGYPAPGSATGEPQVPDVGYPVQSSAPAMDNASLMNVEILALTPNPDKADLVILHVWVNTTAPAEGYIEFDPDLAGKEMDIQVAAGDAASLAVGDVIDLTVSYRGDESGGGYYGYDISKVI